MVPNVQKIIDQGISSVIIFGIPNKRDIGASSALGKEGIVQKPQEKSKKNSEDR